MNRAMEHNTSPISLREAKVFLNGVPILDSVTAKITVTTETWSGRQLGERKTSTRTLGYTVKGEMTRYFTNAWTNEILKKFQAEGKTVEFTLVGKTADPGSDYYANYGSTTVTVIGCVLTVTVTPSAPTHSSKDMRKYPKSIDRRGGSRPKLRQKRTQLA